MADYTSSVNFVQDMPRYKSHKIVRAARIESVDPGGKVTLEVPGNGLLFVEPKPGMFARYTPKPGDYWVVYDAETPDEYHLISPGDKFEAGYTLASS